MKLEQRKQPSPLAELHPHEWLLYIMHGGGVEIMIKKPIYDQEGCQSGHVLESEIHYPTLKERIDAAKNAAPYFASKNLKQSPKPELLKEALSTLKLLPQLQNLFDPDAIMQ